MSNTASVDKFLITGAIAFGDSLSDEGRKYNENICGCIPFKWLLYHSDYNNFTNGHTWAYIFGNIFNSILKEKSTWLAQEKTTYFKNVAEGGATTYDYRNIKSLFNYFKGFILSFFLGNIQDQVKKVKKDKSILNPNKLGIIFAGANDLVTLGYDDAEGVERAIQGITKTIEMLTHRNHKTGVNYLKHLLVIGLPDISETPRFSDKSEKEKLKMRLACQQYNERLQKLANEYRYVNFDYCTIYRYTYINCLDLEIVKQVKKGIIVIGEGKERTIYFINNGKFITNKSKERLKVTTKLSKAQQAILCKNGEIIRDEASGNRLDELVNKVSKKAKLSINFKMLDIGIVFDKICKNPDAYEFTSGCAVYYLPKNTDISKNIHSGNAVIIKEVENEYCSYIIKEGTLVTEKEKPVKVKLKLSVIDQIRLKEKIKQHATEKGLIKLAGREEIHDMCIIRVIQSVIEQYKKTFDKEIKLIEINDSVLKAIKEKYSNRDTIFWDDLHPARRVHDILASNITEFIEGKYLLDNPSNFRDDSAIGVNSKLPESKLGESPGSLASVPSLLYSQTLFSS